METPKIPRTKQSLQEAMLLLLLREPLSDITITQLCQEAGVGRATFYRSYSQPADILIENYNEYMAQYVPEPKKGESPDHAVLVHCMKILKSTPENRQRCLNIASSLTDGLRAYICRPHLFRGVFLDRMPERTANYYRFILMDVVCAWLKDGEETPEQIAGLLISLAKATGCWEERPPLAPAK